MVTAATLLSPRGRARVRAQGPEPSAAAESSAAATSGPAAVRTGEYLGQFDSFRVIACCAVVLQHSLLWNVWAGNVTAWAFVMLLHFSRTAFFFLAAFLVAYAEIKRPRRLATFWHGRLVEIGIPFLVWTAVYWVFTMIQDHDWSSAGSLLWTDVSQGYYQLYFVVVLFLFYLAFPVLLRLLRATTHHVVVMTASLVFALALAADLHYTQWFGAVGSATTVIAAHWQWGRNPITYQEQFIAGILVALHFDQIRSFVARRWRLVVALGVLMCAVATLWYLVAVWTGSDTGRASDLFQPVAFLWFTFAVAALECGTFVWYQRQVRRGGTRRWWPRWCTAEYLAALTGGIFFSHVLFINLVRSGLADAGIAPHLGWAGLVVATFVLTIGLAGLFTAIVLRTRLARVLTGPVRTEQRARLGVDASPAETHTAETDESDATLQPVLA
jgi:peptidoglycan/LPS O-acetylase OafA/YrhL